MDRQQIEAHLKSRAAEDAEFRRKLVSDARSAVAEEMGLSLPSDVKLQVIEETSDSMCLVLPPAAGELADMELEAVAGGKSSGGGRIPPGRIGGGGRLISDRGQG